jgi:hypothetical protein
MAPRMEKGSTSSSVSGRAAELACLLFGGEPGWV